MKHTATLLSIKNLKKYFPVARTSLFQKQQLYVRANEEITLDIKSGATFGLVGESGCGKSTLGRTILQLYRQTAGSTVYYGRTLEEMPAAYVGKTLKHAAKRMARYKKLKEKADALEKACEAAGEGASFFQHQSRNLAQAEAETAFQNAVKVLGGFAALDDPTEGAKALLRQYQCSVKCAALRKKGDTLRRSKAEARLEAAHREVQRLRSANQGNPRFAEWEKLRDNGIDLSRLCYGEMRRLRKDIQIIFQDPYSSLNPRMTVGQIIREGLITHKFFRPGDKRMQAYILDIMQQCGLQAYMLHRYPHQFSGGQRQRICIARALAVKPKFVVCDECVSALDVSIQSQIINLLEELKEKEKLTYLFISHDLSVVRYISDRIGVMYLGNIVEMGDAETVFKDPRHPYTVALLSSIPTTDVNSLKKQRILLEGSIPSPIRPPEGCKFHTRCYMACDKCKRVPPPVVEVEPGHRVACHFPQQKLDEKGEYLFEITGKTQPDRRA